MSAVAGKGGLAVSGGVVISGDTIIASDSDSVEKISEIKKIIKESFDKIIFENISGSVLVSIDNNNNEQSVYISASSSVQPAIESYVDDRSLKIFFKEDVVTNIPIYIAIKAKNIKSISSKGSADIHMEKINGDIFEIKISGASSVQAEGNVDKLNAIANGSGDFDLSSLKAKQCDIVINGSGDAVLNVTGKLSAQINGSGDIIYYGNPSDVSRSVNGSGDIRPDI